VSPPTPTLVVEEPSFEPPEPKIMRPDTERLALLELQVKQTNADLAEVMRTLRVIERIVIALAVAGGGAQLVQALAGGGL
jgi:hypothetical protein